MILLLLAFIIFKLCLLAAFIWFIIALFGGDDMTEDEKKAFRKRQGA